MTECERLVAEGTINNEFLSEEIRDDFLVTKERKKLWAILLDLVKQLDQVCTKYGLQYYAVAGTLLGAVRHKGFIPWDDDIDVALLRTDYEELLKHASEFSHPYFFQTPDTDPNYFYSFAKLGNDNTTYCSEMFAFQGFHAGVSIDIFPLDFWDEDKGKKVYEKINELNIENSTFMRMKNPLLDQENKKRIANWGGMNPNDVCHEINRLATQFNTEKTSFLSSPVVTVYPYGKDIHPISAFKHPHYLRFENAQIPVPSEYHEVLSRMYGDYMQFPPVEKRGVWHSNTLINPDVPYQTFLQQYKKERIQGKNI